jgi:hypothetical protein
MSLGEKIAGAVPDSLIEFVHDHPRVLTAVTAAMVVLSIAMQMAATELDVRANDFRRARLGEIQRAASEALGG